MAVQNENGFRSFLCGEAITQYRCVNLAADGDLQHADNDQGLIGVAQEDAAAGAHCNVKLLTAPGTFKIEAGGSFTQSFSAGIGVEGFIADTGTLVATGGGGLARARLLDKGNASSGDIREWMLVSEIPQLT